MDGTVGVFGLRVSFDLVLQRLPTSLSTYKLQSQSQSQSESIQCVIVINVSTCHTNKQTK